MMSFIRRTSPAIAIFNLVLTCLLILRIHAVDAELADAVRIVSEATEASSHAKMQIDQADAAITKAELLQKESAKLSAAARAVMLGHAVAVKCQDGVPL